MKYYQQKPIIVEAVQFNDTPESIEEIHEFVNAQITISYEEPEPKLIIRTLEGDMKASVGDYIIKGIQGEFYPCKPSIFEQSYLEIQQNEEQ